MLSKKFLKILKNICFIVLSFFICGVFVWTIINPGIIPTTDIRNWIENLGAWGPIFFILFYILSTVILLPGSAATLIGGAIFGPILGSLWSLIGASIGAILAFIIARYYARKWVESLGGKHHLTLQKSVEEEGWRFVAMTRLMPFVPFNLLNYLLGLSRIKMVTYILTTSICILPGTICYTWLGHVSGKVIEGKGDTLELGLISLGVISTIIFLPRFIKKYIRQYKNNH